MILKDLHNNSIVKDHEKTSTHVVECAWKQMKSGDAFTDSLNFIKLSKLAC